MADRPTRAEYESRFERYDSDAARYASRDTLIANARLAVFVLALVMAWLAYAGDVVSWWWLSLPAVGFVALLVLHQRVLDAMARARAIAEFYRRGLERLGGRWMGQGAPGDEFVPSDHTYANDLDIFGRGSLFELICTARTRIGQHTLASWLLAPAQPDVIRERQMAVDELRDSLELREDLALLGEEINRNVSPHALREWAAHPAMFKSRTTLHTARAVLGAFMISLAVAPILGPLPAILVFAVALVLLGLWRATLHDIARAIEEPQRELAILAKVVARIERESWHAPLLRALAQSLTCDGQPASRRLARLDSLVHFSELPHNQFFAPVAIATMWSVHVAHALEQWRFTSGRHVPEWLEAVGTFEALLALAAYAYEHPADPFPTVDDGPATFDVRDLGHPILPDEVCVRNDLSLGNSLCLLVVSGSNMSGKSTLLRMAGVNVVLAQAGAPVRARHLSMSPLRMGATLHVQDSIQSGASRFFAEIARLKQVADLAEQGPTLFLFDEILSGTNSHDRRIGAEAILSALVERGAIGIITTHDLALTRLTERLGSAENMHFTDEWRDGRLVFPYRLQPGVVQQGNALRLMENLGLPVNAEKEKRPGIDSGP